MSRSKSTFWKCPGCGLTFRGASKYHLKKCPKLKGKRS